MKTHPILFSSHMVQAIVNGTKTQTRRLVDFPKDFDGKEVFPNGKFGLKYTSSIEGETTQRLFPKYMIDDVLWIKETYSHTKQLNLSPDDENYGFVYKADNEPWNDFEYWKWKPSIHMPKEAARLFLCVLSVKAERLQDISIQDAIAEGLESKKCASKIIAPFVGYKNYLATEADDIFYYRSPIDSFKSLWISIYGEQNWNSNPWVFAYSFSLVNKPLNFI